MAGVGAVEDFSGVLRCAAVPGTRAWNRPRRDGPPAKQNFNLMNTASSRAEVHLSLSSNVCAARPPFRAFTPINWSQDAFWVQHRIGVPHWALHGMMKDRNLWYSILLLLVISVVLLV